jgi:hypothetical protein
MMSIQEETARKLAQAHYFYEPGISRIFRLSGSAEAEARPHEPVKLLEINENTVEAGIMPIGFDACPGIGIPLPSVIVEVTPDEFEQVRQGRLRLPEGWEIREELPRESVSADQ